MWHSLGEGRIENGEVSEVSKNLQAPLASHDEERRPSMRGCHVAQEIKGREGVSKALKSLVKKLNGG